MSSIQGKNVILGVSGSVAAFKAAALASELTKSGASVRVVLTASGERFVTAETFRDLTSQPVATSLWDAEQDHVDLARWADVVVVAPATANLIARIALGLADDMLSTLLLASPAPMLLAPAMETHMWDHPATRRNVAQLKERGVTFVGPVEGRLASGQLGSGRMAEPSDVMVELAKLVENHAQAGAAATDVATSAGVASIGERSSRPLSGLRIVVTAGPTQEPIDPVRFISNRSSGKMGYELAIEAARRGASLLLISGPVAPAVRGLAPSAVDIVDVKTAAEMRDAVLHAAEYADVVIMAAAVADFKPARESGEKLKKSTGVVAIEVNATDDILSLLAARAPGVVRVGFAAETTDLIKHAETKLREKDLAMIVGNDVSGRSGDIFGADENQVTILRPGHAPETLSRMSKRLVAGRILDLIPDLLVENRAAS